MLEIRWMNANGAYAAPFNSEYFQVDPLGYLDALRKGRAMEDLHVVDAAGRDVTSLHL